ncbi:MAG TPA: hypothetical protein HA283_00475 [Nanoarchaeota archaeon]|nr:hypothetical protein [Nanoarchaeota archaeon]HIH62748.1 hypothetical protein [Nanoarchaeota archaeon]HIJ10010.1 hypothetical protein [Nanoarchaeota archaeon]
MTNQLGEQYELKRKLINNSAEVLERMLKFAKDYKPSKEDVEEPLNTTTTTSSGLEGKIITSDDYWTIQNVNYQGEIQNVDLSKKISILRNFNDMIEKIKKTKADDFITVSMRDTYSLFKAVYESKDKSKEEIRSFLKKKMKDSQLNTTTTIQYNKQSIFFSSRNVDEIIHNYNLPNVDNIPQKFIGPNEFVKDSNEIDLYGNLLGSKDVNEINTVFNWITGKDLKMLRLNYKGIFGILKIVSLVSSNDYSILNCNGDYSNKSNVSLLVRLSVEGKK